MFEAYVLGAVLVGFVLDTTVQDNQINKTFHNSKKEDIFDFENSCGLNNCPQTKLKDSLSIPTDASKTLFYVILIGLVLIALINTFLFMDDLSMDNENGKKYKQTSFNLIGKLDFLEL